MTVNAHLCLVMTSGPQPDFLLYPNPVLNLLVKHAFSYTVCRTMCLTLTLMLLCSHCKDTLSHFSQVIISEQNSIPKGSNSNATSYPREQLTIFH